MAGYTDADQRAWQEETRRAEQAMGKPRQATVRSEPAKAAPAIRPNRALGLFALVFALPIWLEGARTTRDGWIVVANWLLLRFHIPFAVQSASAWAWYVALGALIGFGLLYSRIELRAPLRPPQNWRHDFARWRLWRIERRWEVWLLWIALVASDVATMYLGARSPEPDAAIIFRQIANAVSLAAVYAILITFIPERLALFGWHSLKR